MPSPTPKPAPLRIVEQGGRPRGRHAERIKRTPQPLAGLGPMPEYLNAEQREIWERLVQDAPPGLFARTDRDLVAGYAVLLDARNRCIRMLNEDPRIVVRSEDDRRQVISSGTARAAPTQRATAAHAKRYGFDARLAHPRTTRDAHGRRPARTLPDLTRHAQRPTASVTMKRRPHEEPNHQRDKRKAS